MSKILITGASGFVGSFLVEEALRLGLEVYAGIRATSSKKWLTDEKINFLILDLSNENELEQVFEKYQFEYIIHNAGVTKASKPNDFIRVNRDYTVNLAKAALKSKKLKKFTFISSVAAYGAAELQKNEVLDENALPHPVTKYGKSKLAAEEELKKIQNLPLIILRPTGIFGPRETDFFHTFKIVKNGFAPSVGLKTQWLSLIYIKDLKYIVLRTTLSDYVNKSYFVSDGNVYKTQNFLNKIALAYDKKPFKLRIPLLLLKSFLYINDFVNKLFNKNSILNLEKYNELKIRNLNCDITPLVLDYNFNPMYELQIAINETAEWYKINKWL